MSRPKPAVVVLGAFVLVVVGTVGFPAGASADTIELVNGSRVRGKITKLTETSVSITTPQGMTMTVPLKQVHAISDKNGRRVINEKKTIGTPASSRKRASVTSRGRTRRGSSRREKKKRPIDTTPAYKKEVWPQAKLLVWANPGQGGNFRDAKNWKGGSAPNKNTDILLPAADKPYIVHASRGSFCRHCTIEKNAAIIGKHGGGPFTVWGNCWVKEGGRVHFVDVVGPKHTFFRLDGGEFGKFRFTPSGLSDPWNQTPSSHIHHKMQVTKFAGGSVEFMGNVAIGDEFYLSRGKMIVSGEFRYNAAAGKGTFEIFDGAVLELQTGGRVAPHKAFSRMNIYNMSVYRGGTLQAGSPERPLTGDTYLRLGFDGAPNSGRNGLYCAEGSKIRVYSADPKKARLVITGVEHTGDPTASGDSKGIEIHVGGDVELDGVLFDCFRQGGIRVADMETPKKKWKNMFLGSHNAGGLDRLVAQLVVNTDVYYHDRVYMRFGRVLEGLNIMQKATGERIDILYPTSGKIFTHGGIDKQVRWAPGGRKTADKKKYEKDPPQAQEVMAAIEKTADKLRKRLRGKKATDRRFVQRHRGDLVAIGRGALALRKSFPDTASCRQALAIAAEFGIKLPKK